MPGQAFFRMTLGKDQERGQPVHHGQSVAGLFMMDLRLIADQQVLDIYALTLVEFAVSAVCALPFALLLPGERAMLSASSLRAAFPAFAYVGLLSSGVAYTFQTAGQARTPPALAAILMSLESVFGALAGWLVLSERLTRAQAAGCALVFAAVVLSQVWESLRGRRAA